MRPGDTSHGQDAHATRSAFFDDFAEFLGGFAFELADALAGEADLGADLL
jgi:hypothetical protein